MIARRPGTILHRVAVRDRYGHPRDRDEVIAQVAGRAWAAGSRYLEARGRWHLFEREVAPEEIEKRAAIERRRLRIARRSRPRAVSIEAYHSVRGERVPPRGELKALLEANAALLDPDTAALLATRPRTRGECVGGPRPCPWVSCRHHLALDVNPINGTIKLNHPDLELEEMADTCVLDVADRGPQTCAAIGRALNVTRERARQIELRGLRHLRPPAARRGL